MFSRTVGRYVAFAFRNRRLFHQSIRYMDKDEGIKTYEFPKTAVNESDSVMMIKSARNSYELLNIVSKNGKSFRTDETLVSLQKLFELQKETNTSINSKDILSNSDFQRLCRSLQRNARFMELNDVIDALKILSFVGVKADSVIMMSLLNLIKHQINDVSLGHIVFLDYVLYRLESTPLVEAILMALPMLLQIQISTKLDHENVPQLVELLKFVGRHRVGDACIMNLVSALRLHSDNLDPEQARSVVWSLASQKLQISKEYRDKLLEDAIRAMSRGSIGKEDIPTVCTTLSKMTEKYLADPSDNETFFDEKFFNLCGDAVVTKDCGFENATFVQLYFNQLGFVHIKLLKYMLHEMEKYPALVTECRPTSFVTLVYALAQANFKPQNWDKIKSLILGSNMLTKEKRTVLPWPRLSLELLSLGIECPAIWNRIFSKEFLTEHLASKKRIQRLLRILELYQVVSMTGYDVEGKINEKLLTEAKQLLEARVQFPMQQCLELAFGGPSYVYTKVKTRLGHIIDHVIAFDKQTMEPARIEDGITSDVFYEDIATDSSKQYIAVLFFPSQCFCVNVPILRATYELKLRTYAKMGINAVYFNQESFNEMLESERIPYVQREVKFKVAEQQNVLQ